MSDGPAAVPAVPETKPVSELTRIALAALEREYQRHLAALIRAAADVEGVDLTAGWGFHPATGTWIRTASDGREGTAP